MADDQRALALGIQSAMFRVFGSIPGPIIFGALFDATCISWQYQCGRRGSCWLYDKNQLSYSAVGLGIPINIIAITCYFIAGFTYPKKKDEVKEEKNIELS